MKKIITFLFLFIGVVSYSQINDLASLSSGEFFGFSSVFDKKENLNGYIALYSKGKVDEKTIKLEYVYLDKNLNKVSNKEFQTQSSVSDYYISMDFTGNIQLTPQLDYEQMSIFSYGKIVMPDNLLINLKDNTVTKRTTVCYENKSFIECPDAKSFKELRQEYKKERKENGMIYESSVTSMVDGTFLVYEYNLEKLKVKNNAFIKFDKDKKEVWRYEYNKDLEKKQFQYINVLHFDQKFIYFIEFSEFKKENTAKIIKIDLTTGERIIDYPISDYSNSVLKTLYNLVSGYVAVDNKKEFDDNLVFVGSLGGNNADTTGYFRMIIDNITNKVSFDKMFFEDAKKYVDIDKYGTVERGYTLKIRDLYFMKNGSVGLLFEKFKIGVNFFTNSQVVKTTDLVYFNTDSSFKLNTVKVLSKEKSKNIVSDYLFSQSINEDNDVAFFYRDYLDDSDGKKNWSLYINSIKNGEFNQEQIPISSKQNTILPYVAKEGYILLREFNKKDKYNGIRLERLNY